ncbi:hypothetical protein [Nocardia blacklockiae]|uniref:hypothetical protein n=1 Tax=Nocardia blacklockiae TaxID=480036 RepID=UPI001895B0FF|nr:hypothetical protein [Nocardia blacklockiae]MBF6174402.1 hypothetical protein [Nocardia blacklockiae]
MTSGGLGGGTKGLGLDAVRWHLLRQDAKFAAVTTRAAAVLSTNALVVAGTALAFTLNGSRQVNPWVLGPALGTLVLVAASVTYATQALVLLRRRRLSVYFATRSEASALYSYTYISRRWRSFDDFRESVMDQSPEQQLRGALDEMWRTSHLHLYRYLKFRKATWLLLASIGLLLTTVASAALSY